MNSYFGTNPERDKMPSAVALDQLNNNSSGVVVKMDGTMDGTVPGDATFREGALVDDQSPSLHESTNKNELGLTVNTRMSGDKSPNMEESEVPGDPRAFFGHPLSSAEGIEDDDKAALALLHEYQNLPAIDNHHLLHILSDSYYESPVEDSRGFSSSATALSTPLLHNIDAFLNHSSPIPKEANDAQMDSSPQTVSKESDDLLSLQSKDDSACFPCDDSYMQQELTQEIFNDLTLAVSPVKEQQPDCHRSNRGNGLHSNGYHQVEPVVIKPETSSKEAGLSTLQRILASAPLSAQPMLHTTISLVPNIQNTTHHNARTSHEDHNNNRSEPLMKAGVKPHGMKFENTQHPPPASTLQLSVVAPLAITSTPPGTRPNSLPLLIARQPSPTSTTPDATPTNGVSPIMHRQHTWPRTAPSSPVRTTIAMTTDDHQKKWHKQQPAHQTIQAAQPKKQCSLSATKSIIEVLAPGSYKPSPSTIVSPGVPGHKCPPAPSPSLCMSVPANQPRSLIGSKSPIKSIAVRRLQAQANKSVPVQKTQSGNKTILMEAKSNKQVLRQQSLPVNCDQLPKLQMSVATKRKSPEKPLTAPVSGASSIKFNANDVNLELAPPAQSTTLITNKPILTLPKNATALTRGIKVEPNSDQPAVNGLNCNTTGNDVIHQPLISTDELLVADSLVVKTSPQPGSAASTDNLLQVDQPSPPDVMGSPAYDLKSPDSGYNESCVSPVDSATRSPTQNCVDSAENVASESSTQRVILKRRRNSSKSLMASPVIPQQCHRLSSIYTIPKLDPAQDTTGYSYHLEAAVSQRVRIDDDRLTYLNKSQFYGLTLSWSGTRKVGNVKSLISVVFRETKPAEDDLRTWSFWHARQHFAQQRVVDIDEKSSVGYVAGSLDRKYFNAFSFNWLPGQAKVKASMAIHCLGTDFSCQKGIKGIPLHIQIDTYEDDNLVHRGYCQVKVFSDKGAERKTRDEGKRNDRTLSASPGATNDCTVLVTGGATTSKEEFHPPLPRSPFYSMADLQTSPILFQPDQNAYLETSSLDGVLNPKRRRTEGVLLLVREPHEAVFTALSLSSRSLRCLLEAIKERFGVPTERVQNVYHCSSSGILLRITDDVMQHIASQTMYIIGLQLCKDQTQGPRYDVILTELLCKQQ